MSAPVNVLAVMEDAAHAVHIRDHVQERVAILNARDAVAELIEAIKPLAALDLRPDGFERRGDSQPVYARGNTVITVGDVRRASAALARVQGGAA